MAEGKQYRYATFETRNDEQEPGRIAGYFAVFDDVYEFAPGTTERIDRDAFNKTLQEDTGDIRCLWNHDPNIVLGRTGNDTLRLRVDDYGLFGEVLINGDDSDAVNALARIERGDVSQCSIGFEIVREEVKQEGDRVEFVIREAKLWEVSPVTFPAYKATAIAARSEDAKDIRREELRAWKTDQLRRLRNGAKEITRAQ